MPDLQTKFTSDVALMELVLVLMLMLLSHPSSSRHANQPRVPRERGSKSKTKAMLQARSIIHSDLDCNFSSMEPPYFSYLSHLCRLSIVIWNLSRVVEITSHIHDSPSWKTDRQTFIYCPKKGPIQSPVVGWNRKSPDTAKVNLCLVIVCLRNFYFICAVKLYCWLRRQ